MNKGSRKLAAGLAAVLVIGACPVQSAQAQNMDSGYEELTLKPYELDFSEADEYGYIISSRSSDVETLNRSASGLLRAAVLPRAYMNDINTLTSTYPGTKNQGNYDTCWAFSAIGLAEFDLITDDKLADKSVDLSELQLAYFTYNHAEDPLEGTYGDGMDLGSGYNYLTVGGNLDFTTSALMSWKGVTDESKQPYVNAPSTRTMDNSYAYAHDVAHLQNVYLLNINKEAAAVKEEIMKHGSVGIGYHAAETDAEEQRYMGSGLYNGMAVDTYYCDDSKAIPNHAVNVVGWDDDFPAESFRTKPGGNGAWLIRNSWSDVSGFQYGSYFWLSYYDAALEDAAWVYDFEPADNYDHNYQYNACATVGDAYGIGTAANVFTVKAEANEQLEAVSFSMLDHANVPYTIKVYVNLASGTKPKSGCLAATLKGTTGHAGIYTVPLKNAVPLAKGTKFSVVVEIGKQNVGVDIEYKYKSSYYSSSAYIEPGQSFALYRGSWVDMEYYSSQTGNYCIKAYTSGVEGKSVAQVKSVKKKAAAKKSITLSWSKVSGASGYEIYRATSANGAYKKVGTVKSGSKTSFKDTGLAKNKTYYYRVRAYKTNTVTVTGENGDNSTKTTTVGKMSVKTAIKTSK